MTCDYSEVHRDSVPNAFRTQANRNPMPRLTKTRIDKLKPDPSREIFVWCTDPRRFGLRIFPTGRKTFVIQYGRDGRTRRYAIGTFGRLTVEQARARAKELFAEIAMGGDPSSHRKSRRNALTVAELADRYLDGKRKLNPMFRA